MTIEEIQAALKQITDAADGANDRDLTDEEIERYLELEEQLKAKQRSEVVKQREQARNSLIAPAVHVGTAKEDDTLERAFGHYLRTGRPNADMAQLAVQPDSYDKRAQSEGTGSEGGYLVPDGFRNKLVERMKAFGGIANVADTVTTSTGNNISWPTIDDTGNVGEIVSEGGTFAAQADFVFGTANLGAYSYMAGGACSTPVRVSLELLQDNEFDLEGFVSRALGTRIARVQAVHLATGDGVQKPLGLVTGLTGIELADDAAGIVYNDLITFLHSVDPAYRGEGSVWVFNDFMLATIKKLKDSHGDPLWRPADAEMATGTGGGTLLGYPVVIDQALPNMTANSNTINWGAFGNIREGYVVRRVREVQILVNPYSRMGNRQIEYMAWARMDATQQNTGAYIALTGEA